MIILINYDMVSQKKDEYWYSEKLDFFHLVAHSAAGERLPLIRHILSFKERDNAWKENGHARTWSFSQYLAGPSGQHCRCFGVVDILARSVFGCRQCTGEVDIWGPTGIVARLHAFDCAKHCPYQNIKHTKTLTTLKHRMCQSVNHTKALTTQKHEPHQKIM